MQRPVPRNPPPSPGDVPPLAPLDATVSCLWGLTVIAGTLSLLIVVAAILTNQWLHTEERMHNPAYNGTGEKDYLGKLTYSGLWTLCYTNPGEHHYYCSKMDYFSKEEYSPDPNDSTLAIPYAVTRSMLFFMAATLLLCCGYCCCLLGHCSKHRLFCTFISGLFFIVSGLVMLFGLVMYISVFKAEVGGKLRPRSQLQGPRFTYRYGYSFLMYVTGFVSTELAGISAVCLFIQHQQRDWHRRQLEDMRRGKVRSTPPPVSINYLSLDRGGMMYPCRRHPQAYVNSNSAIQMPLRYPSPVHQKRYYFNKEPITESPCSIHRHRSASSNSLKDITSSFYDFPPPPTISYQFNEDPQPLFSRDSSTHRFPRDLTANTVSTTADVNCEEYPPEVFDDYSPSIQHESEFVTFDLDAALPLRAQSVVSMTKKDAATDAMRRTTPV